MSINSAKVSLVLLFIPIPIPIPYNQIFSREAGYFRVLAFILVGEAIFIYIEEKFAYRWSIKKLTVSGEVLFSARLAGAQAAAETNMRFKYAILMCS